MINFSDSQEFNMRKWREFLESAVDKGPNDNTVIYVIFLCVIFVVSLIGNSLTCIVIYLYKSMHTVTNYYLFNLAISDLMLTFVIIWEIFNLLAPSCDCSPLMCKITWFSMLCLWNSGIFTLTALSVERYFAICHPLKFKSSSERQRVLKIIVILWVGAIADSLPELLTVKVVRIHQHNVCFPYPSTFTRVMHGFQVIVSFAVPVIVMSFVYTTIAIKVNAKKKNLRDKVFNLRDRRGRVNKLIAAMTGSFLVSWLPFFTTRVLLCTLNGNQFLKLAEWFRILSQFILISSWLSVVLNPILFSLVSTKFRTALKALWNEKIKRRGGVKTAI